MTPRGPARGCANGLLLALILWAAIAYLILGRVL